MGEELNRAVDFVHDFYAGYDPDHPETIEQCTAYFHESKMLEIVNDLLDDEPALAKIAKNSYRHNNGFDKIVLAQDKEEGWKLRLHIWWPGTTSVEDLHEHRWNFASQMISGMYYNWEFYQDLNVNPENLTLGQKKVLNALSDLETQYHHERTEFLSKELQEVSRHGIPGNDAQRQLFESSSLSSFQSPEELKEALAEPSGMQRLVQDIAKSDVEKRMDVLFERIKFAKEMLIGDEVSVTLKGGQEAIAEKVKIDELCDMLNVTVEDLKEFLPIYTKYDLTGVTDDQMEQVAVASGLAEMEGPHISQVFQGSNRHQPIRPAHRLIIDPSLSGTTSTLILTEKPRDSVSQLLRDTPIRAKGGKLVYPSMTPEALRTTLGKYRDFLMTREVMREHNAELAEGKEKPVTTRTRSISEEAYSMECSWLPVIHEYQQEYRNSRSKRPSERSSMERGSESIIIALENVLERLGPEYRTAFQNEMQRNLAHHEAHDFAHGDAAYFRGEKDALKLEAGIVKYAKSHSFYADFLQSSNKGVTDGLIAALDEIKSSEGRVSKELMETVWLVHKRTEGKNNCENWNNKFPQYAVDFISQGQHLPPEDAAWITERLQGDKVFGQQAGNVQARLEEIMDASATGSLRKRDAAFWQKGETADIKDDSEHLGDPRARYGFLAAHSRLIGNFREIGKPHIVYQ